MPASDALRLGMATHASKTFVLGAVKVLAVARMAVTRCTAHNDSHASADGHTDASLRRGVWARTAAMRSGLAALPIATAQHRHHTGAVLGLLPQTSHAFGQQR